MKLRTRPLEFESGGKYVVILNQKDADFLGLHPLERVSVTLGKKQITAIINITTKVAEPGEVATNCDVNKVLGLKLGDQVNVEQIPSPASISYIRERIAGNRLNYEKVYEIVNDVVHRNLSEIELTGFVTALETHRLTIEEAYHLSQAMIDTGRKINIKGKYIVDKHSIGGIPGDKTSLLAVPIVAAAGLTIPKTSSRAITSPAGTGDRMEVFAPVSLSAEEIVRVVKKTGGCLVWGGALELAPADDAFIQIEYPLGIDPLLLPSIMSKKKAVGSKYVVIDIPTGRGAKIKTIGEAQALAENFIDLGKKMGMEIRCAITYGEQPLGHAIGPALEAREALLTLQGKGPADIMAKVSEVVGILFEMTGKGDKNDALRLIKNGKAEKKMREIIGAQGGNEKVKLSDIPIGTKKYEVKSEREGHVLWIKNADIVTIAKRAGAPKDKGAGIELSVKTGDSVRKGQTIYTIYSNNNIHLNDAIKMSETLEPLVIGKRVEERMLSAIVKTTVPHKKAFALDR